MRRPTVFTLSLLLVVAPAVLLDSAMLDPMQAEPPDDIWSREAQRRPGA